MFKKFLSKIGIGSASVNLVLDNTAVRVGEELTGTIFIEGGNVETRVQEVFVALQFEAKISEEETINQDIVKIPILTDLVVQEGQSFRFPFQYMIPELPPSGFNVEYKLMTSLDIPGAVDKYDFDDIVIYPRVEQSAAQEAFLVLGFQPAENSGYFDGTYQGYGFRPLGFGNPFAALLDELEVIFLPTPFGVHLHLQIDKRGNGYEEFHGLDRWFAQLYLENGQLQTPQQASGFIAEFLYAELANESRSAYPTLQGGFRRNNPQMQVPRGYYEQPAYGNYGAGAALADAAVGTFAGYVVGQAIEEMEERYEERMEMQAVMYEEQREDYQDGLDDQEEEMEEYQEIQDEEYED